MTEANAAPARARSRALIAVPILFALTAGLLTLPPLRPLSALRSLTLSVRGPRSPDPTTTSTFAQWPAPPFFLHAVSTAEADRATRCLTDAIYYEAGDQSVEGQRAVAQVVLNRVRDPNFPKSVCGVVYEGGRRKTGCQFSFACDGSIHRRPANTALWERMRPLAVAALNGHVVPEVGAATHYYADYVTPNWLSSVAAVTQIGQQIFCAWRGRAGLPSALTAAYRGGELKIADMALDGARPRPAKAGSRRRVETVIWLASSGRSARA